MTFLAPAFLLAGLLAAGIVLALHFIVPHEPRPAPLPTARFAPDQPVRAQTRALRPRDLGLLAMRVGLLLAVGAALAGPQVSLRRPRRTLARILLVDRSRAVAQAGEAADSARARYAAGDAVVLFDSGATTVRDQALDSLAALAARPSVPGRLSAALIAALQAASRLRETADSFELTIISPLVTEELDEATDSVRALWPGAVRLVRIAATEESPAPPAVGFDGRSDDPLRIALPPQSVAGAPGVWVRIVRGALDREDSAWARAAARVLVHWPPPAAAEPRDSSQEIIGAVIAGDVVVVAPLMRTTILAAGAGGGARVVARWVDGEPAAIDKPWGAGCIRTVAVGVPERGDLVLEPRFARFVAALVGPCGGRPALRPVEPARLVAPAGAASPRRVARRLIASPEPTTSPWATGLLLVALALAAAEPLVRRR